MREFTCKNCGFFFKSRKACKSREPKFCSKHCYAISIRHLRKCRTCQKDFYGQNKFFCSRKCAGDWKLGKVLSEDHKSALRGTRPNTRENFNHRWKGDDIGYNGLHDWVYRNLGSPMVCEFCKKECQTNKQIHWANKSGEYKRNKEDWLRLCVSCHKNYDLTRLEKQKI